ncbi:hypothetical protein QJS04_geneDACA001636 [Acorus gramineus]|uniref:Uncharacterized protein n=1 Tax=Acorus gramineus TaxID=55184 RepID=A0AAV9BHE8_ACOGR|nr:hypothetical protein QJS04_geneDACA001636 [Acorus gramineus]
MLKGLEGHEIDTCASLNENMINHSTFHNSSDAEGSCLEGSYAEGLGLEGTELRKCRFKMLRLCLDYPSDLKACVLGRLVLRGLIFMGPFGGVFKSTQRLKGN